MADPAAASASSSSGPSDESIFQRWQSKFSRYSGIGGNEGDKQAFYRERCEYWKRELTNYSPAVTFMMQQLKLVGADVHIDDFICLPCKDGATAAGFVPAVGVIKVCQDRIKDREHMETTMAHELVHMYDHAKFKVDWTNLRHHACSEIRANSLSGDCKWGREALGRGFLFKFSKQHQECVRRRAITSVASNASCPDRAAAERVVNEVWESCFNDTRPFDEVRSATDLFTLGADRRAGTDLLVLVCCRGVPDGVLETVLRWAA
ncbi:peptidase M76 family-domain-containing protein [Epithele typhae]|uniref:peptidase M76 family-domain-containing protein n=1 Tax=Epithele typhae TaxID=378194 RepID=UPI002008E9B5|nr:peptidase M76 family-domain-containing protein [Epithele typhae]KAH9920223.1 peptidase M76 family-domain-containing protein [Epithele typhae]